MLGSSAQPQSNRVLRGCLVPCSLVESGWQGGLPLDSTPLLPVEGALPGPLLPELAQLRWLEELMYEGKRLRLYGGIPPEWGQPGAFPRLLR